MCTPSRPDLVEFIKHCIAGGVDVVQLREKNAPPSCIVQQAKLAGKVCHDHNVPFILNDRPDLALEAEADGVHVGQDDVSATACRKLLGKDAIVGLSTHATLELDNSLKEPVNYISAGPVVATPTKPGRNGTGIDYIRYAASHSCIPVFVTGGVTPESIPELIANGVKHFVVVRYLTESEDPQKNAAKLRTTIDEGLKNLG